jgi:hypothetical protein
MKKLFYLSILVLSLSVSCQAQKQTSGLNQIITKQSIGLGNVNNTSDSNKPLSVVQKSYIDSNVNAKFDKIGGGIEGNVGIGIPVPTEKFHVRWGHIMLEGDGVSYKAKNGIGNVYAMATLGNNNVFAVANNLLKLDPQWGSTALTINGGLVASNVPIYINSPGNNFIVKTVSGGCRKIVVADDGVITAPEVVCP